MTTKRTDETNRHKDSNTKVADLEAKIIELNQEVLSLRSELFKQRDELHGMRNSRVLGRIIKTREFIGNPFTLPKRSLNKVRRTVARYVPDSVRLPLMKSLRKTRDAAKNKLQQATRIPPTIVMTEQVVWNKETPLVSVVIPFFNRADTIDETLDSLISQTFPHFEVIIVDDGSTEVESVDAFRAFSTNALRPKLIKQKNQGVAAARNNGIEHATGKYVICLDSDDVLTPTFIEKALAVLETDPSVSIVTTYMTMFGVMEGEFRHVNFDPIRLYVDNTIITAAMFRKDAWQAVGGYKSNIGYEDWEFWLNLVEHNFWVKLIPEPLFLYRTSLQSRYVQDKDVHWSNLKLVRSLHPNYKSIVRALVKNRATLHMSVSAESAFINADYLPVKPHSSDGNILITIPWMTFGGAETLIYNFCREIKDSYNITFVTGLRSENEWEYKFREITDDIFHLPNLFDDEALYIEYVSTLVKNRNIDTLHIIHNGFTFAMLEELKKRYPELRVITTLFNDRAAYFEQSLEVSSLIDIFTSDNNSVIEHYKKVLTTNNELSVIPNGVNTTDEFNPANYDRDSMRNSLDLKKDEVAVFYIGRLSEEKNPNVFVEVADSIINNSKERGVKFFVVGDGNMRADIERQIKAIGSSRIRYLGYQSAVAQYLSAADIFVLPSSIEGFPLSIIEAMAMRVVVIASDVGAVAEAIDNGNDGFVVEPGSASEIVTHVKKLAKDEALRNTMKTLSRNKVELLYSNLILGKNYRKLYRRK